MNRANRSEAAVLAGVYESPRRRAEGVHPFEIHAECISGALADAGLTIADVDGFCTAAGDAGEGGAYTDLCDVVDYLGIEPRYHDSTDNGGASFITHAGRAMSAIADGRAEVVVVSYAACPRSFPIPGLFWDGLTFPTGMGQFEIPFSPTLIGSYALAAHRHMHQYGTTSAHLAEIAVRCRANAGPNVSARYRDRITVDDVLDSPMIASPLRLLDCCVLTEGGGAVVLVSRERAADLPRPPVRLLGFADGVSGVSVSRLPGFFDERPAAAVAKRAFAMAGVSPADVDVAQLYDGFTIMVAMQLEDLGFCGRGEFGDFVDGDGLDPEKGLPINTDGGGLSSNQCGRRGMFNLIEAARQLRGDGPGHQVQDPKVALAYGLGGFFSSCAVMLLGAG